MSAWGTEAARPRLGADDRRRLAVAIATLVLCTGASVGLRYVPGYGPFRTTGSALAALRTGELASLRAAGLGDAIDEAITIAGRDELTELRRLEASARTAGDAEYERLARRVAEVGQRRFDALPRAAQSEIRDRALLTYLLTEGARSTTLPPGTEPATFMPSGPDAATSTRLGKPSLAAGDAARLGDRTAGDPSLEDDVTLLEIAVTAAEDGERLYLATRRALLDRGERAFHALPAADQGRLRSASYLEYVYTEGFAGVDAETKQRIGDVAALLEDERADSLRLALGRGALSPEDRTRLGDFDSARLGAAESDATKAFVATHGERRVVDSLRSFFREARCEERGKRRAGSGAGDVFRRGLADERQRCRVGTRVVDVDVRARWNADAGLWELDRIENWASLVRFREDADQPGAEVVR